MYEIDISHHLVPDDLSPLDLLCNARAVPLEMHFSAYHTDMGESMRRKQET